MFLLALIAQHWGTVSVSLVWLSREFIHTLPFIQQNGGLFPFFFGYLFGPKTPPALPIKAPKPLEGF